MRPRGYRPSDPNFWYDPRTGMRVDFDTFLRIADEILKARDLADRSYEAAIARWTDGVPPGRRGYWRRRLSSTRANLAEAEGFAREIDAQLSRPTPGQRRPREQEVEAEPRFREFELGFNYDAAQGAQGKSQVMVNVRFHRRDGTLMTMRDAWDAIRLYRRSPDGSFPHELIVEHVDWQRPSWSGAQVAESDRDRYNALHDFLRIAQSIDTKDMDLTGE